MTATQWLFEKLWDTPKDKFEWYAILKKAEEMYEKQMFECIDTGIEIKKYFEEVSMQRVSEAFEGLRKLMHEENGKIHADKRNLTD
jgi:hypothetical protein